MSSTLGKKRDQKWAKERQERLKKKRAEKWARERRQRQKPKKSNKFEEWKDRKRRTRGWYKSGSLRSSVGEGICTHQKELMKALSVIILDCHSDIP